MAYGVKYRADWQSPMRDKRAYRIEILEDGYTGDVLPLYPTGDVLTITRGNIDDDDKEYYDEDIKGADELADTEDDDE